MPGRGAGRGCAARFALAVVGHPGWRSDTLTTAERVHRDFRPQNTTVSVSERAICVEIEIARSWRNRIVNANSTIDLPHSFVVLVRELRICKVLAFPYLPLTFTSAQHPAIAHFGKLGQA